MDKLDLKWVKQDIKQIQENQLSNQLELVKAQTKNTILETRVNELEKEICRQRDCRRANFWFLFGLVFIVFILISLVMRKQ